MKVAIGIAALLIFLITAFWPADFGSSYRKYFAGLMPIETASVESLREKFARKKLKILLVPGHDNLDYGTEFRGVREADLNREVAGYMQEFLLQDGHFEVLSTRDFATGEYKPEFASYFQNQGEEILSFRQKTQSIVAQYIREGIFNTYSGVSHNTAPSRIAQKLYGISKWANENRVDIVLHAHFNDHAGRRPNRVGEYAGFTIYVPEKQYSAAKSSYAIAESVFGKLSEFLAVSSLPGESKGITEDQELIALGANGSLDAAALLIEYGYIYEPQFTGSRFREDMMRELGYQTYLGVKIFFDPDIKSRKTTLLPFSWQKPLKKGERASREVLALQFALKEEGLYPPTGKTLADCALTGNFGQCTFASVALFQEKYSDEILKPFGFSRGTGIAGSATLKKLQELYPVE